MCTYMAARLLEKGVVGARAMEGNSQTSSDVVVDTVLEKNQERREKEEGPTFQKPKTF